MANRICQDWLGEDLGSVSKMPHETREVQIKEKVILERDGKKIEFKLIDTPGIATKIDFEDFMKFGHSSFFCLPSKPLLYNRSDEHIYL